MISIKCLVKLVFISLIFVVSLTCVFASENATVLNETGFEDSFNLSNDCELTDVQDSSSGAQDSVINITMDNYKQYFRGGALRETHSNSNFIISEDMANLGILRVLANNVSINGLNHTLTNTVFSIEANNVTLNNLTLIETEAFEENEYAAVLLWRANDANLCNLNINYTAPTDSDAYGIYSLGTYSEYRDYRIYNLQIINCTVNLKGDNRGSGRDYGLKLEYSPYARVINNTVNSEVSMRSVNFHDTTASLDSEFSLAVGIDHCDNLLFDKNIVTCSAGARPECAYPTLDAVFIGDSANCNFTNNEVYLSDYLPYKDIPNYLYAMDIYRDDNLLVETIRFVWKPPAVHMLQELLILCS